MNKELQLVNSLMVMPARYGFLFSLAFVVYFVPEDKNCQIKKKGLIVDAILDVVCVNRPFIHETVYTC